MPLYFVCEGRMIAVTQIPGTRREEDKGDTQKSEVDSDDFAGEECD